MANTLAYFDTAITAEIFLYYRPLVGCSHSFKYKIRLLEVADSEKHTSLLSYGNDYDRIKLYGTGPRNVLILLQ